MDYLVKLPSNIGVYLHRFFKEFGLVPTIVVFLVGLIVIYLINRWQQRKEEQRIKESIESEKRRKAKKKEEELSNLLREQKRMANSLKTSDNTQGKSDEFISAVYHNLYDELKSKCNPINFMTPYNAEQVNIANEIFSKLNNTQKDDIRNLILLRNKAIKGLGITYTNPKLYETLCNVYNPKNFMGENYDANKLNAANKLFAEIEKYQNDILSLESIAKRVGLM